MSSPLSRPEPAIIDGQRFLVEAGVVLAHALGDAPLRGFRSLPKRLGGGYLLWTDEATFRAVDFLGALRPIVGVAASGGARPWLSSFLLRTERGLLEVDPATLAVRRFEGPARGVAAKGGAAAGTAIVDAIAVDERRAIRVNALGRASYTLDAGASFSDIAEARGLLTEAIREADGGVSLFGPSHRAELRLAPGRDLEGIDDNPPRRPRHESSPLYYSPPAIEPSFSMTLGDEAITRLAASGALLPGDRAIVGRASGVSLYSTRTARLIDDADLRGVSPWLSRCQPLQAAPSEPAVLLACAHARGAHVFVLDADLGAPHLEATSSEARRFVGGERGRLAFVGRCGATPPSAADFARNNAPPPPPEADEPSERPPADVAEPVEPPAAEPPDDAGSRGAPDDVHVCVRGRGGRWIDRSIGGEDAQRLYRWIPGDDGEVVALVLKTKGDAKTKAREPAASAPIIRLDPRDPALKGGSLPALMKVGEEPPFRMIDADFRLEDDGSIQGWIELPPGDDGDGDGASSADAPDLSERVGGRFAGLRVTRDGRAAVFPLPPDTESVVRGGRFGLAMALTNDEPSYFETTDGGRTWSPVVGPPVGRMEAPSDADPSFACSSVGCSLGAGIVRLGWGGPPPSSTSEPPSEPPSAPAMPDIFGEKPRVPSVSCVVERMERIDEAAEEDEAATSASLLSIFTTISSPPLVRGRAGASSAVVIPPFQPSARPRSITIRDASDAALRGPTLPLLTSARADSAPPVDLIFLPDTRRTVLSASSPSLLPFDYGGRFAGFAELRDGAVVAFDTNKSFIVVARGGPALPVLRVVRPSDAASARFTIAQSLDASAPAIALVGYSLGSGDVFAGPLDLGRAEIGVLRPLGAVNSLVAADAPACSSIRPLYRFVADVRVPVRLRSKADQPLLERPLSVSLLVAASAERLCVEGLEIRLPGADDRYISASFSARGGVSAALRSGLTSERARCAIEPASGSSPP